MIWKNPFSIKNSEQDKMEFLSLFDSSVLQIINEENLEKVSLVCSTPGAGKTSLFNAFSPQILNIISNEKNKNEYKDILQHMQRLRVISSGKVTLLSTMLSCARGYPIFDEMFDNGRRKQVLFALLNYRITIIFLKNLMDLLDIGEEGLKEITFKEIPQEMLSEESKFENALSTYNWACEGEKELCKYLDSSREETLNLSFVHTTLLVIKLFESQNLLVNNEEWFCNSLLIIDDFHTLTKSQRKVVLEALYTLKSKTAIWLGQRLEGLSNLQIISMDGSIGRDYNSNIVIDNYWSEKAKNFYGILENIANRRVKEAGIKNFNKFADCLGEKIEIKRYKDELNEFINKIKKEINIDSIDKNKYLSVMESIDEEYKRDPYLRAIYYECLKIRKNRDEHGQLTLDFGQRVEMFELIKFYEENKAIVEYYLCYSCNIPFYYGLKKLQALSSYNIEQFLYFTSDIFEGCRTKSLGNENKRKAIHLTAEEQEQSLHKSVNKKWMDMDYRYKDIERIKLLLSNIAALGIESRNKERGSYAGGAYTGIGINSADLKSCIADESNYIVTKTLGECLASKYLERYHLSNGEITVFYLNRWLCIYYELPLAYGGWKKCNINKLKQMCLQNKIDMDETQISLKFNLENTNEQMG